MSSVRPLSRPEIPSPVARRLDEMAEPGALLASFGRHLYLLVCAGQVPTAGYDLRLRETHIQEGRLTVALTSPDPDLMVAQVITYPTLAVDLGEGAVHLREVVLVSGTQETVLPLKVLGPLT